MYDYLDSQNHTNVFSGLHGHKGNVKQTELIESGLFTRTQESNIAKVDLQVRHCQTGSIPWRVRADTDSVFNSFPSGLIPHGHHAIRNPPERAAPWSSK